MIELRKPKAADVTGAGRFPFMDAALAALAVGPPVFALAELSGPMLLSRVPSYPELYATYRYRRPLVAAGAVAGAALLRRARRGEGTSSLAKVVAGGLGGVAALVPLVYDPLLFGSRETGVRVRRAEEAEDAFEQDDTEVFGVLLNGEARAYPARKAARPHLIFDVLGGESIAVSYCGLTNSAVVVYRATESDGAPSLSVVSAPSSNILYWEARTRSLVQQLRPAFAYGPAAGRPLRTLPVAYTTWAAWRRLVPETTLAYQPYGSLRDRLVTALMRRTHAKTRVEEEPFMAVAGEADRTLHPKARVFALHEGGEAAVGSLLAVGAFLVPRLRRLRGLEVPRRALAPYGILLVLLAASNAIPPVHEALESSPAFSGPGPWLLLSAAFAVPLLGLGGDAVFAAARQTVKQWLPVAGAILTFILAGQVIADSGAAALLAGGAAGALGRFYPVASPLVGALGGALTGSNAGSNALFMPLQVQAAAGSNSPALILAAIQNVAGSQANLLAPQRIILAATATGLVGKEAALVRAIAPPVLIALAILMCIGAAYAVI
jgi:hypothetical protein